MANRIEKAQPIVKKFSLGSIVRGHEEYAIIIEKERPNELETSCP